MKVTFYGGAKSVTGANYLIECGDSKILVDCGLFQGSPEMGFLNEEDFPYNPAEITHVFVTHSHQDHCGRLPKLVAEGFRGEIVSTKPARDMMKVALEDAARLIDREAEESGYPPIYSMKDVKAAQKLMQGYAYESEITVSEHITVKILNAGHILGSAMYQIFLREEGRRKIITFTGDIGNYPAPLLPKYSYIDHTDYLVMESAYGDRNHESVDDRAEMLRKTIRDAIYNKGVLMIPSFAIERTQILLYEINTMVENKEIPHIPVFIDSPLAIKMTRIYQKYAKTHLNFNIQEIIRSGDDIFDFPGLTFTESKAESKMINKTPAPKIIIAGSGMSTGGRILFHEKFYLDDPKNFILFVGYQVKGSLGRKIRDGEPVVEIMNQPVTVRAHIREIGGYSAHADQTQLVAFVDEVGSKMDKIFIVQGEYEAAYALKERLESDLGQTAEVPKFETTYEL